ncbi:MAG: hypothetical protein IT376_16750 [Polyangiaceae bacterium]|nr:hypothetical protein [Polyangiaceae bacterium]
MSNFLHSRPSRAEPAPAGRTWGSRALGAHAGRACLLLACGLASACGAPDAAAPGAPEAGAGTDGAADAAPERDVFDPAWGIAACVDQPEPAAVQPGAHAVDRHEGSVASPTGEIPVRLFAPRAVLAAPLVVVFPGGTIHGSRYDWLGELLASHGHAVLIAQRTGSGLEPTWATLAAEAVTTGDWATLADPGSLLLVGHSYGGTAALCNASPDTCPLPFQGSPPTGLVGVLTFASHAQPPADPTASTPMVAAVPVALVGGGRDARVTPEEIGATWARLSGPTWRARAEIAGANHYQMIDCLEPEVDHYALDQAAEIAHSVALERAAVVLLAFAEAVRSGDPGPLGEAGAGGGIVVEVAAP